MHRVLITLACLALLSGCKDSSRPPSLGEAIGVAQPGGHVTQLFMQGSVLPAAVTEAFTTSEDNQKRLFVHVVRGAGRKADKLSTEGFWSLDGVAPGPRGTAKVMVTFEVDAQGQVSVVARQDDKKLKVHAVEKGADGLKPAALLEPDDEDEDLHGHAE